MVLAVAACGGGEDPAPFPVPPVPPGDGEVTLRDATGEAGLPGAAADCLVFEDLDGDERADLLLAVPGDGVVLARNAGDGTFALEPLGVGGDTQACSAGDYDGDGIVDLVVGHEPGSVTLLRGLGGGEFEDASALVIGLGMPTSAWLSAIGFVDADGDGLLDLYVMYFPVPLPGTVLDCGPETGDYACHAAPPLVPPPPVLLHNDGSAFVPVDGGFPAEAARPVWTAGTIDWDEDGRVDVFQPVDFGVNALWRNAGGRFEADAWPQTGADRYNHGMGAAFGDYDRDGDFDVLVADLGPSQLWYRAGDGRLEDRAPDLGIAEETRLASSWSPVAADLDQDGWLDFFLVTSIVAVSEQQLCEDLDVCEALLEERKQWDFLFVADGDGGFAYHAVSRAVPNVPSLTSAAAAAADFDGDGDVDIAEVYELPATFRLLRNETTPQGHWLALRLRGAAPRTAALGALVTIERGGDEDRRLVQGEQGGVGKSTHVVHFGLGAEDHVDRIRIRWPSGLEQTIDGPIAADQLLVLTE
jgi:enediyne biosynthesis protein E4